MRFITAKENLASLIFEDINSDYGWGKYGEFKLLIRKKDGYVNATKMCKDGGKRFDNWIRLDSAHILVEAFKTRSPQTVMTGSNETRGTYVHPDLIPHIASWISPKFAVFVSRIISEWKQVCNHNENVFWEELGNAIKDSSIHQSKEKQIQIETATREGGICEVQTPNGFIDILTSSKVIELKTATSWKHAVGQVIIYGLSYPDKEKWIYLFEHEKVNKTDIENACLRVGVRVMFI